MNPDCPIDPGTDGDALIKKTDRYLDIFNAVRYLSSQHIHCLIESESDLTLQAFYQALRDAFPLASLLDGARQDGSACLAHRSPATDASAQPAIVIGAEKLTPDCYARLTALARCPERAFSGLILLARGADKKRLRRSLRPLSVSCFSLGRLTRRECFAWLDRELEQRGLADGVFSDRRKRQLIGAGQRFPERIRLLALTARSYLCNAPSARVAAAHIRAVSRACNNRWLSGGQALLLAALIGLAAGCGAWAIKEKSAAWLEKRFHTAAPTLTPPGLQTVSASGDQAMQQLFGVWGYQVTLKDATCENALRAGLRCITLNKSVPELIHGGNPWIAEILWQDKRYYAVVVGGAADGHLDMLMAGKTWRASKTWLSRHAAPRAILFTMLSPSLADKISFRSPAQDIRWLDSKLSQILLLNPLGAEKWSAGLEERVKRLQKSAGLQVDGLPGSATLMAVGQQTGEAPALKIDPE